MWVKYIIVDKTVKRINKFTNKDSAFVYAFAGFSTVNNSETWTSHADDVKLYDTSMDVVIDAKKLQEQAPVEILQYNIIPEQKAVSITIIKF